MDRQHKDGKNAHQIATWLLEKAHGDEPFFMVCGIQKPHVPFLAPDEYFEMYPPADLKLEPASVEFWNQARETDRLTLMGPKRRQVRPDGKSAR